MRSATHAGLLGLVTFFCAASGCNSPDATVGSTGTGGQGGAGPGSTGPGSTSTGGAGPSSASTGGAGPGSTGTGGMPSNSTGSAGAAQSSTGSGGMGTGGTGSSTGTGGTGGVTGAWAKGSGFSGTTEQSVGVSVDSGGDIILAGFFDYSLDFGSGPVVAMAGGYSDIFLARFAATGQNLWTKSWGDGEDQRMSGMVSDGMKIVVAGSYDGAPDLGSGALPMADWYQGDIFVAAYATNGNGAWFRALGADMADESVNSIALDTAGNVLVTGMFEASLNIKNPPLVSAGSQDIFVAKLSNTGTTVWAKSFGDTGYFQEGWGIASDNMNNVIVTGVFDGIVNFGGMPLTASGSYDLFVASFNPDGTHRWSKQFVKNSGAVEYPVVATDSSGNVFVAGYYYGFLDFGLGIFSAKGDYDAFIAKLDPNGNTLWTKSFGTLGTLTGMSQLAVDPTDGSVWLAGFYRGTTNFGGGPLPSAGSCTPPDYCNDAFLVKLDKDGNHLFSRQYGGVYNDFAAAVDLSSDGSPVMSGNYSIDIDFGGGTSLTNGNYSDIFLVKFQ